MLREDDEDALRDDRFWDRVWERVLDPVERHHIAVAVWRRRLPPSEVFEYRIAVELARRWRRRALSLAVVYALWSVFWGAIALSDWRTDGGFESLLCPLCALVGVAAVAACCAVRRRLRCVAALSRPRRSLRPRPAS